MEPDGTGGSPEFEGAEEVLEVGAHRRTSRWRGLPTGPLARAGAGVLVVAAIALGLLTRHAVSGSPTALRPTGSSSMGVLAPTEPPTVRLIRSMASQRPGLIDYTRSSSARGACVLVSLGAAPQLRVSTLVERSFAGFEVTSIARTIDEYGQLCELRLIARNAHGTTLVVRVVSPQQARADRPARAPDTIDLGGDSDGRRSVSYVSVVTAQGWSMLVGSDGPVADQPAAQDMLHTADDPAMRW